MLSEQLRVQGLAFTFSGTKHIAASIHPEKITCVAVISTSQRVTTCQPYVLVSKHVGNVFTSFGAQTWLTLSAMCHGLIAHSLRGKFEQPLSHISL